MGTSPDGNTDLTFKIDNATAGTFQKAPDGNATYLFNQTVFAQTDLSNRLHTITIESGLAGQEALVLLDSIIYTADDNSTTSSSDTSLPSATGSTSGSFNMSQSDGSTNGVIVGPVVAAVIVVLTASIALFLFIRKRRRSQSEHDHISAFGGPVVGGANRPRSHDPDTHDMQQVVNTGPLNEHIVKPSVTSVYPVTASGSNRGADVRTFGLDAPRNSLPPDGRTDLARNVAPSQVDGTVFSDGVSPPAYDAIVSSSVALQSVSPQNLSNNLRPLPPART